MKRFKIIIVLLLAVLAVSCKSFKVLYTWSADDKESVEAKNILVVARTANLEVRQAFEREITKTLTAAGMKATSSYTKFPNYNPEKKVTEEEKGEIKRILEDNGYNAVVMTVLKDYQEDTRSGVEGGYEASVNYGYIDRPTYFGWGFYAYFYHPLGYSTEDIYVEETDEFTITSKLYVLDSIAFNLDLEEEDQMVGHFRASIENPDDAVPTAKSYAKAIAKQLDN
ncbi:MAG: hypothetical protein ACR2MM_11525 [Flavobacteriaceae bacterium]